MKIHQDPNRRKFLEKLALMGISVPLMPSLLAAMREARKFKAGTDARIDAICVFSKHLQFLNYDDMARVVAEIGFDGIDLTVRPEGHVLPENVERDLPRAIEAAKKAGVSVPTITTSILSASEPYTEKILATASGQGVKHYRMGWLEYDTKKSLVDNLEGFIPQFKALADLNKKYNITGDYQNHSGIHVGAPVWDIYRVLDHTDPHWIGSQYDVRHATFEGGNCWPLGLELIQPYIHTIVIKDFYWKKTDGKWDAFDTPVGEGMVDFTRYFGMLKKFGTQATAILHFEYPLTRRPDTMLPVVADIEQVKTNMKKDLNTLRSLISAAEIGYK
jgi:sugar phosphate isomerase/epimerase